MAAKKGRKPAITNVARPEGFIDDVVRPIVSRVANKVGNKTGSTAAKNIGIRAEMKIANSYNKKVGKLSYKEIQAQRKGKRVKAVNSKKMHDYSNRLQKARKEIDDRLTGRK